jgi:hypothetical protein
MAISLKIDRIAMRQMAAAMAFVMMVASLPAIGVIVISDRSGPTISMDICHPLQSLGTSTGAVAIARPAKPQIVAKIVSQKSAIQFVSIAKTRLAEAPDPPPPKPLLS